MISGFLTLSSCGNQAPAKTTIPPIPVKLDTKSEPITTPISQVKISIKDFTFNPAEVTIKVWTTVTWTNEDSAPHTATLDGEFDSKSLSQWQSFSYTFTKTWTFDYICTFHPHMMGKIIVN